MWYPYAVKQLITAATRLKDQRDDPGEATVSADVKAAIASGEAAIAAAEDERTVKWESVLLLGTSEVIIAARAWHQSAFRLEWMALGRKSDMTWDEAVEAVSRARRAYYEAAKADLGIGIGSEPEAYEWQLAKMTRASTQAQSLPGQ
jgi:hypothetical protein